MREIDTEGVRRAKVVVETREAALAEAGDLLIPIGEGAIGEDHIMADLAEVVRGASVRGSADDITLFKSVGNAFEDLIVARAAVDRR
jgi:ornithine cyclodeaminase/alanine dehydrogenase-like protein (mu-crystallin family)